MNEASGMDHIPAKFLKEAADLLADALSRTINLLVKLSIFLVCKSAKLKPQFKKCSKTNPKNYQPISLYKTIFKKMA